VNSGLPSSSSAISAVTAGSLGVSAASERRWAAVVSAERSQLANSSLAAGWKNVYRIVLRRPGGQSARPGNRARASGHGAAEAGQPAALRRVAAEPGQVFGVVGHQHRPHTKVVERLDHGDLAAQRVGVLQVETHDQAALLLGGQHVLDG
jgi:hypothetical protein